MTTPDKKQSLDDILNHLSMQSVEQHVKDSFTLNARNRTEAKQAIKSLFLGVVKESRNDPEIYWGNGEKIIRDRINSL